MTQGGLQSTEEAINAMVPLIGIPMLGDQWYNTEKYVHHKIGVQLDILNMDEKYLKNAIETVINDPRYGKNLTISIHNATYLLAYDNFKTEPSFVIL